MSTRTKDYENRLCVRVAEAAEILGLGANRVYALVSTGELPSVRLGGKAIRLPLAQLRALVDAKISPQAAAQAARNPSRKGAVSQVGQDRSHVSK